MSSASILSTKSLRPVSVVICTRNRAESLRETLRALAEVHAPPDTELLVIDNGSSDHTAKVVNECHLRNLQVHYVRHSTPGLSHARNRALTEATGRVLLFTDDDVLPPPDWVDEMSGAILSGKADAVAGGVIFPKAIDQALNGSVPRVVRSWFASTEELEGASRLVGANMAVARHVFDSIPGFDVALGAGALGFGEETLFSMQMIAAQFRLCARLDMAVEHHFDLGRLTKSVLLSMAERMGRSQAYISYHWKHDPVVRRLHLLCAHGPAPDPSLDRSANGGAGRAARHRVGCATCAVATSPGG